MYQSAVPAPISWGTYANLQASSERRRRLDHKTWALDEQMDSLLDQFAGGELNNSRNQSENPLQNIVPNRAKKYRRRAALLRNKYAPTRPICIECRKLECLCTQEAITRVRRRVTKIEWLVFKSLANGDDYAMIALRLGLSLASLKSQLFRSRARLREIA